MKRKDIEVGVEYAVVKRLGNDAKEPNQVGAKVVEMGVEYEARRPGGFRSYAVTMTDGIRVEFVEPMVERHFDFMPLSSYDPSTLREEAWKELQEQAITTTVLPGSRHVIQPWADLVAMRIRWDRERQERKVKIDAAGDTVEPVFKAVMEALREKTDTGKASDVCKVKTYKGEGVNGKRVIDATFTFNLDDLARLLGVAVEG